MKREGTAIAPEDVVKRGVGSPLAMLIPPRAAAGTKGKGLLPVVPVVPVVPSWGFTRKLGKAGTLCKPSNSPARWFHPACLESWLQEHAGMLTGHLSAASCMDEPMWWLDKKRKSPWGKAQGSGTNRPMSKDDAVRQALKDAFSPLVAQQQERGVERHWILQR